jgi:hypothetical protein
MFCPSLPDILIPDLCSRCILAFCMEHVCTVLLQLIPNISICQRPKARILWWHSRRLWPVNAHMVILSFILQWAGAVNRFEGYEGWARYVFTTVHNRALPFANVKSHCSIRPGNITLLPVLPLQLLLFALLLSSHLYRWDMWMSWSIMCCNFATVWFELLHLLPILHATLQALETTTFMTG